MRRAPGRHHLRVAVEAEARFWAVYDAGTSADAAAHAAGVGRSTGYRWLDRRFCELRAAGFTVKGAQRLLRLTDQVTARAERQRAAAKLRERQAAAAAHEEALRSSRGALPGPGDVGLYLLGSLAIGDFDLTSDVDFMIVTDSQLSSDQVELVQSAHTKLIARDSRWVKHLEYSIFPVQKLSEKSSPYGPNGRDDSAARQLWYFNNGGSAIERSDHDNTLVTRWTLRYRSKAVQGPEPAAFAPEVTSNELRQEIRNSMLGWEKLFTPDSPYNNRFHQVFFVLNNCRALQGLHEGKITSKREGAKWAKQHLDAQWHALIDYCWQERQDTGINVSQPADPRAFQQTVAFIAYTTRLAEEYQLPKH